MAGPAAPDLKDVSHREALYFSKDASAVEAAVISAGGAGVRERAGKGKILRDIYEKNPARQGRDAIEALRPVSGENITPKDMADTLLRFGAGHTKLGSRGKLRPETSKIVDTAQKRLVESSFNETHRVIENITGFLIYSELVQEAERTGKSATSIMTARKYNTHELPDGITTTDFDALRRQSLDYLSSHPSFRQMFPELETVSAVERHLVIESMLVKDPRFRQLVVRNMQNLRQEARNLPQMEQEEDYKKAEEDKTNASKSIKEIGQKLRLRVGDTLDAALGSGGPPAIFDISKEVQDRLKKGFNPEEVVQQIADMYEAKMLADPTERAHIEKYWELQAELKKAQQLHENYVNSGAKAPATEKSLSDRVDSVKTAIIAHEGATITPASGPAKSHADMVAIMAKINAVNNRLATSIPTIKEFVQAQEQEKAADSILTSKDSKARRNQKEMLDDRMQAEAELTGRMQDILPNAVVDLMLERHDAMTQAQKEALEKEAAQADKDGKKETAAMIRRVVDNSRSRRIHYDEANRRKVKDRSVMEAVATDMQYAIYHGEPDEQGRNEGIKRLVLRDMALPGNDANGVGINWKTTHFDDLTDEQRAQFDSVYSKTADRYRDKLFADFFMSRGALDKAGFGRLGLKDHEMELIERYYGDYMDKALNASKEAKDLVKKFEQEGRVIDKKSKLWMFVAALLMAAGGGLVLATGGAALAPIGAIGLAGGALTGGGAAHSAYGGER